MAEYGRGKCYDKHMHKYYKASLAANHKLNKYC